MYIFYEIKSGRLHRVKDKMKKYKYLHLMPDSIYSMDYIERVNRLFVPEEHFFVIHTYDYDKNRNYDFSNVYIGKNKHIQFYFFILRKSIDSETILLHSIFIDKILLLIFTILTLLHNRMYIWIIWGGDLILEHEREEKIHGFIFQKRIKRQCRKIIIRNIDVFITYKDDYEYVKNAYKVNAGYLVAPYAYNLPEIVGTKIEKKRNEINIFAGHSASPVDKHEEIFRKIADNDFKGNIYSILSYDGTEDYINTVKCIGKTLFNDRFHPIQEWMSRNRYMSILEHMDIAIFMADRQIAVGNIIILLLLGVKIFANNYGIIPLIKEMGGIVYDIKNISKSSISTGLSQKEKDINHQVAKRICSDEFFYERWNQVFTY